MAPLTLTGDNLGEKHRSFNALVNEAIANKLIFEPKLVENEDLNNLLKIDFASAVRNVDFILEVYKCEDMLYVSRALKRTTWLITDTKYAHIIQTNYLYNELFPQMTMRAMNKLLLNVRLHLKEEARVEEFYNYIKLKDRKAAFKWLPKCSIPFIENEVQLAKIHEIPNHILQRLFERSFAAFKIYFNNNQYYDKQPQILASQNTEKIVDLIETVPYEYKWNFSRKTKKCLMKMFPERIFNNLENYYSSFGTSIIAKYVRQRPELRQIMISKGKDDKCTDFFRQRNIRHWIKLLPKENRFEIVKKNIMMREDAVNDDGLIDLCAKGIRDHDTVYEMYKYAPFNIAFEDLKKLIRTESNPATRNSILLVLLTAAGDNMVDLKTLLEYYYEKHANTPCKFKIDFINAFISQTNTHTFDDETWEIFNKLFQSSEVYINSENNVKHCIDAIIVRNVIRGIEIPPIVKSKFVFSTLKEYEAKLKNASEKKAVFYFLYNYINEDINVDNICTDTDFCKCLTSLNNLSNVLKDWNKSLSDYPDIPYQIKKLIEINKKNNYVVNLSTFYFTNKEWRRTMFEESIILAPSDKIIVNAIKHDAKMFDRHKEEIVDMLSNDNVSLKQALRKIRVFWPDTISKELKTLYNDQIENNKGNKTAVSGFCTLVTHKELQAVIEKYVPSEAKIDWDETDERLYNVRKNIARTLYQARPIVPIDFILLYAKGDYLQYTVPSLCAVLSQLSPIKSGQCIAKFLNAPVSLQKFGIRYPFLKLTAQHLVPLATKIWNSTKNSSIRTVLVSSIHSRLCKEIDESQAVDIWRLLSKFIDDLTCDENNIFHILSKFKNVPQIVRPDYIMKVYRFLDSLHPGAKRFFQNLKIREKYIIEVMHLLDDDFVIDCLLKDSLKTIKSNQNLPRTEKHILTSFILCNKDEDSQVRRYKKMLDPILDYCIANWTMRSGETTVRFKTRPLLKYLPPHFIDITVKQRMNIPYKVFSDIQSKLEGGLSYEQNYTFLTYWKIIVEVMRVFNEFKEDIFKFDNESENNISTEFQNNVASLLGKFCAKTLKEDSKKFDSCMYQLFTRALTEFMTEYRCILNKYLNYYQIFKHMLENSDEADTEIYMAVTILLAHEFKNAYYCMIDLKHDRPCIKEIQEILQSHSSPKIKIHYDNLISTEEKEFFLNNFP